MEKSVSLMIVVEPDSAETPTPCTIDKPAGSEQDKCRLAGAPPESLPPTPSPATIATLVTTAK